MSDHSSLFSEVKKSLGLIEAWIESKRKYEQIPGISAAVVHDRQILWSKGFGFANPEKKIPAAPDTIYRIASISKLFTATAIMQLRDRGKLHLHDPITRYLPWFQIQNPFPDASPITIWHLLTHTSGLPREAAFPYWTDFVFPTREQIMEKLAEQTLVQPPEWQWKYSNLGLTLAGEIVAAVSGQPYDTFVEQNILQPLEMTSTSVSLPEEHRARLAVAHGRRMPSGTRCQRPFTDSKGLTPAANLSSTVEDLARFAMLQFQDTDTDRRQILKAGTLRQMHRTHWLNPDWKSGRGLGFATDRTPDRTLVGHGGNVAGYTTHFLLSPQEKVAAIVMTNVDDGGPKRIAEKIIELVAPAIQKENPVDHSEQAGTTSEDLEKYVGLYRNHWSDLQILHIDNQLLLIEPETDDPRDCLALLEPDGENAFRLRGQDGFQEIGERLVFFFDAGGKIERIQLGENDFLPAELFDRLLQDGKI